MVLPTLLRGKLVDIYIELSKETRGDLAEVKKVLMSKAGLTTDPLVARKELIARIQRDDEPVNTFASELNLLFGQAYPSEEPTSGILLTAVPHRVAAVLKLPSVVTEKTHITGTS